MSRKQSTRKPAYGRSPRPTAAQRAADRLSCILGSCNEMPGDPYRAFDRVRHALFGDGLVRGMRGPREGRSVVVEFDGQGTKELQVSFCTARLRRLLSATAFDDSARTALKAEPISDEALRRIEDLAVRVMNLREEDRRVYAANATVIDYISAARAEAVAGLLRRLRDAEARPPVCG